MAAAELVLVGLEVLPEQGAPTMGATEPQWIVKFLSVDSGTATKLKEKQHRANKEIKKLAIF